MNELPPGFVLDEPAADNSELPPGFVLDEPSAVGDVVKSVGTGLIRGVAGIAGLPGDLETLAGRFITGKGTNYNSFLPTTNDIRQAGTDITGITLHEPETRLGRYAETVGEFIPAAAGIPSGGVKTLATIGKNILRYGVVPGIASEGAGEATKDTPLEPWARAGAAIAAGGAAAVLSRPGTAAQALGENLPRGLSQTDLSAAKELIDEAGRRGVGLTWPEALAQATKGRVDITDLQRVIEQTRGGRPVMTEFMAERPGQVRQAAESEFSRLGPSADPVRTGIAVQDVSSKSINQLRQRINSVTERLYNRGGMVTVDPAIFGQLNKDPLFKQALASVRSDPVHSRFIAGYPDQSVAVLNEIKKNLDGLAGRAAVSGDNTASAVYGGLARDVRGEAAGASPDYAKALSRQADLRQSVLNPAEAGPLGAMAKTDNIRAQASALFPDAPIAGSERVVGQTVRRIVRKDPALAAQIVRSHLATAFDEAAQANIAGANSAGGAKFAAKIIGNAQQEKNLEAAIKALPGGEIRWRGFQRLMEVFKATGKRQAANSATEPNRRITQRLEQGTVVGTGASVAASPGSALTVVNDWYKQFRLGRNSEALAKIITDPGSEKLFARLLAAKSLSDRQRLAATLLLEGGIASQKSAPLEITVPIPSGPPR